MAGPDRKLLGRYSLGRVIVRGDRAGRVPSLYEADDGGLFLFAKVWNRNSTAPDAQALWNHEVRSLLRIGSYPRAGEFFVRIRELGSDEQNHVVVIDAGDRRLLSQVLPQRTRYTWLRDLNAITNRRRMWDGVRRIATGLSILHAEGTLHRSLSSDCIFTDVEGNYDFRLSGFEWSIRIGGTKATSKGNTPTKLAAPELEKGGAQSFASDWFDLGLLIADILGLPIVGRGPRGLENLQASVEGVSYLTRVEKDVIGRLLTADLELRLSKSSEVLQALSEAGSSVRNRSLFAKKALYVGVSLGPNSKLTEAIVDLTASSNAPIKSDNVEAQVQFIQKDIAGDVQILIRRSPTPHYVIDGRLLQYRVLKWEKRQPTWDVGYCGSIEWPTLDPTETIARLDGRPIEIRAAPKVNDNLSRVRQMAVDWTAVFPFERSEELLDLRQRFTLNFFRLTNQLDALLTAAKIWPVKVVRTIPDVDQFVIEVTPVRDGPRDLLAQNLGISLPDEQMRAFFADDESSQRFSTDVEFTFSNDGVLGRSEQESRVRWRFKEAIEHSAGPRYRFWHEELNAAVPAVDQTLYIMPREIGGSVAQLKRRHRAIENMRNHAGLLSSIESPDDRRHDFYDGHTTVLAEGEKLPAHLKNLDASKRGALSGILSTQPVYTLQGPPGTGKTHLLDALVTELLTADPSTQILVSAQSHEAVDIVKRKIARLVDGDKPDKPLLIRLDDDEDALHVSQVARGFAASLAVSDLASACPAYILRRAIAAVEPANNDAALDAKSFEALIRSAANVVFSTSNSGELERMLEYGQRFDWSIVEEAGKAHGFDLVLALQASHRLLLIGDQEQLPPFNFEALEDLLSQPLRIRNALMTGGRFAPGLIDRSIVSENVEEFESVCAVWRTMIHFFAELYRRCEASERDGVFLAKRLGTQHRMHPDIAELVSSCFYDGTLETDEEKSAAFATEDPPFSLAPNTWLPAEKIVFLDLPWVQAVKGATGERGGADGFRRYSNTLEAEVACRVLAQLRARKDALCDIQVLTPYHAQRKLLLEGVREKISSGALIDLAAPEFKIQDSDLGMTVDSFQGGEADFVLASLVRNNDRPRGQGLGILAQRQRLNVLLSRARHKLVLVGSWSFLASRLDPDGTPDPEDPLWHIHRFLAVFNGLEEAGKAKRLILDIHGNVLS